MAYKRDIDDVRESPALDIIQLLRKRGASVAYCDPHVASIQIDGTEYRSGDSDLEAARADCVVIVTDHASLDYTQLVERAPLIVDPRTALRGVTSGKMACL